MATPLIGGEDTFVFTDPVAQHPHPHRWWAERGMVRCQDLVTGQYKSFSVSQVQNRIEAIHAMIGNSRTAKGYMRPDECAAYQRFVQGIVDVCRKAHEQGRPDVPAHMKQLGQQVKAARQSRMVVVPGLAASF